MITAPPSTARDGKPVRQYLERHAEPAARIGAQVPGEFANAVVVPACAEGPCLDRALASVPGGDAAPTLAVVVLNAREDAAPRVHEANAAAAARISAAYPERARLGQGASLRDAPFGALAVLRATLPRKQGVGLARKHGHDFVLGAWAAGRVRSDWHHATDADVRLPADYFSSPDGEGAASIARFRHVPESAETAVHARVYDLWLRYHVLGLHWAGSPYAFHSIGSTIAVDAASYAAVRGFPRRAAGEDFYLLGKLAKVGAIRRSGASPIRITARVSDRVPFGTGRALGDARRGGLRALPAFHHPDVYRCLRAVLEGAAESLETGAPITSTAAGRLPSALRAPSVRALDAIGFDAALERVRRSFRTPQRRARALRTWFDAFRTMKLLHRLRDDAIPSIAVEQVSSEAGFVLRLEEPAIADDVRIARRAALDASGRSAAPAGLGVKPERSGRRVERRPSRPTRS